MPPSTNCRKRCLNTSHPGASCTASTSDQIRAPAPRSGRDRVVESFHASARETGRPPHLLSGLVGVPTGQARAVARRTHPRRLNSGRACAFVALVSHQTRSCLARGQALLPDSCDGRPQPRGHPPPAAGRGPRCDAAIGAAALRQPGQTQRLACWPSERAVPLGQAAK